MSFHPTCFEIYQRASHQVLGHIEIDALFRLRGNLPKGEECIITHSDDVYSCREQVWNSIQGTEYLVANPIFIPALKPIIESSKTNDESFSLDASPFPQRTTRREGVDTPDPFSTCPKEIIYHIIGHLNSPDIANLRLSSRAFEHLPISIWHDLLKREMPFFYEAWSPDAKPSYWATADAADMKARQEAEAKFGEERSHARTIIRQNMPEVYQEWIKNEPTFSWPEPADSKEILELSPQTLPHEKTNWYQLYRDIMANWENLKGLQNRKRIWEDMLKILEMVDQI
jgi:hypothetical protein